jgi:hypothetical protein
MLDISDFYAPNALLPGAPARPFSAISKAWVVGMNGLCRALMKQNWTGVSEYFFVSLSHAQTVIGKGKTPFLDSLESFPISVIS